MDRIQHIVNMDFSQSVPRERGDSTETREYEECYLVISGLRVSRVIDHVRKWKGNDRIPMGATVDGSFYNHYDFYNRKEVDTLRREAEGRGIPIREKISKQDLFPHFYIPCPNCDGWAEDVEMQDGSAGYEVHCECGYVSKHSAAAV